MPQLVKKRRSGWAVLAAGALVASLLAVGSGPAAALDDDSVPNAPASTSACVGDAAGDMMFSDVSEMHAFWGDINCLAYYGVTIGYGDGTFRPNIDIANAEMVLFMERSAEIAGADAEAVVGDFATTGSDPVNRGDMALLIARLLVAATTADSLVNVTNNADGTFAVGGVADADLDNFADSRRLQNRVSDSAASALYELGVARGTGGGNFSPNSTVSRGEMAAFITRALAHTSARPEGVSIQTDGPGEVLISVRDSNFHPVTNAAVDVFTAPADQVDDAFNEDGSCNMARVMAAGGNTTLCEIDALDAVTGLSGDYDPGSITVNADAGGTTVWAWTGESGDTVEDGGEGLAHINLTETVPLTADGAKVTTDIAEDANRVQFGDTVTVTIQLVGGDDDADAVPVDGGNSYTVTIRRAVDTDIEADDSPALVDAATATSVSTQVVSVDATGMGTFTITASDPDPADSNNPNGDDTATPAVPNRIDRVRVSYTVAAATGGLAVEADISSTDANGVETITFSDARSALNTATVTPVADFGTPPMSGSASNVVTVTVIDQYANPIRGYLVRLSSSHDPGTDRSSTFPVARRTDSSGSVRIGYTYTGAGSTESLVANTSVTAEGEETLTPIPSATGTFYWASRASGPDVASAEVLAADIEQNTLIIADATNGPQLVVYDDNDQFSVGATGAEQATDIASFEMALTADADDNDDTIVVSSYESDDSSDVARFVLTVN